MARSRSSREIMRRLKTAGWQHVRTAGSHYQFRHPQKAGTVTVPHPVKDMPPGTVKSIEQQSGMKLR
jgi:predicted RNA binding protein YcfA (HicA-like mRNA interferase family)